VFHKKEWPRSTVSIQRNADCLLKNTPTKHNTYAVNQNLRHLDDISFREHFWENRRVGIPLDTNCAPLLADLFLYLYQADFIEGFLKKNEEKLTRSFNLTLRYTDDAYRIYWEIYTRYAGGAGILLHINGKFTMGKLKAFLLSKSFALSRSSLSI
jgi:hypothetical protein